MEDQNSSNSSTNEQHSKGLSRRNLVKGLAAAPVITSAVSRPAWGTTACSISGLLSGNLSRPAEAPYECTSGANGQTPGFWMNHPECWPAPYKPAYSSDPRPSDPEYSSITPAFAPGTNFAAIFGATSSYGITFMDILDPQACSNGAGSLEFHLIAAMLNAAHPSVDYGKTEAEIIEAFEYVKLNPDKAGALHDILDNLNNRPHVDAKALVVNASWSVLNKEKNMTCE